MRLIVEPEYTHIEQIPINFSQILEDRLRYLSPKATAYNPQYASGRWDGFNRLYDRFRSRFPTGLLYRVKHIAKEEGIDLEIVKKLPTDERGASRTYQPSVTLRGYQHDAVATLSKWRRGVVRIPTGGGKTEVAQSLIATTGVKRVAFLVPSRAILHQTIRRFQAAFPDALIIQWGDGKKPSHAVANARNYPQGEYILVATVQSAFKDGMHPLLQAANMVFVDESHHTPAETFKNTIKTCKKARYLIGLSATPWRNEGDDMELEAWIGPIVYQIDYEDLITDGYLVPPRFSTAGTLRDALNQTRGKRTMVFTETIDSLSKAQELWNEYNAQVLTSKSGSKVIQKALKDFAEKDGATIAATPMFDEGLDVPNIEAVIFFDACGARTRAIQRIGRGLRPAPGKKECLVVDVTDEHYYRRLEAYRKEPAFDRRL